MKKLLLTLPLALSLTNPLRADTVVVFNEIMYHPATNEPALEWVELRNQMAVDVDISGWSIAGGIQYTFGLNSVVPGGGLVVVAVAEMTHNKMTRTKRNLIFINPPTILHNLRSSRGFYSSSALFNLPLCPRSSSVSSVVRLLTY